MTTVIGICGQMGAGKDTVADYLVDNFNYKKIALADPFKEFAKHVFNFSDEQLWGESNERNKVDHRCETPAYWATSLYRFSTHKEKFIKTLRNGEDEAALESLTSWMLMVHDEFNKKLTARSVLQTLGTEWGQSIEKTIWVNAALHTINKDPHTKFVISDVRFKHEIERLVDYGGQLIRLARDTDSTETHISEKEILTIKPEFFSATITNNKDKQSLYNTRLPHKWLQQPVSPLLVHTKSFHLFCVDTSTLTG